MDLLQSSDRTILVEGLSEREFVNLAALESSLLAREGIESADCYVAYRPDNTMGVLAKVNGTEIWDLDRIQSALNLG